MGHTLLFSTGPYTLHSPASQWLQDILVHWRKLPAQVTFVIPWDFSQSLGTLAGAHVLGVCRWCTKKHSLYPSPFSGVRKTNQVTRQHDENTTTLPSKLKHWSALPLHLHLNISLDVYFQSSKHFSTAFYFLVTFLFFPSKDKMRYDLSPNYLKKKLIKLN